MLVCLQVLLEKVHVIAMDQQAFDMFIDYSKAFDSVSHNKLFSIFLEMGFPKHLVTLIQSLYVNQRAIIRWDGEHTEEFEIGKGARQGCILSPYLFVTYTESGMREADVAHYMALNLVAKTSRISDMPTTQHLSNLPKMESKVSLMQ